MPKAIAGRHAQRRTLGEDAAAGPGTPHGKGADGGRLTLLATSIEADVLVGEQVDPRRDMESNASRWGL